MPAASASRLARQLASQELVVVSQCSLAISNRSIALYIHAYIDLRRTEVVGIAVWLPCSQ